MNGLRIAQVCSDRGIAPGGTKGASQHLRGLADGALRLGHGVVTFARRSPTGAFPTEVRPITELASVRDVDVVYERYALGHVEGLRRARRLGVPFVLEVNAPLVDEARAHRAGSVSDGDVAAERLLLAEADLVIAVSSQLATWVGDRRRGPTIWLSNGFEPSWFDQEAPLHERAMSLDRPLVFLGHPRPWHDIDRIVALLEELARTGHHPGVLVIGGGAGVPALREVADAAGLGERIEITGELEPQQATRLLRRGAIGLAPYRRQSPFYFCPLKIVDYLAAGLAVVSADQGDIACLVGDAGIVVDDPDDDVAMADAIRRLLDDDALRLHMAESGRRRAHACLTWQHVAAATVEAIAELPVATTVMP